MSEQLAREGFGELNTSPYYWIFTSVSVGSIPCHYSVAEPGEVTGDPPSPLIFRPNWGPEGPKKNFFEIPPLTQGLDERPHPPFFFERPLPPLTLTLTLTLTPPPPPNPPPPLKVLIRRRYWLTHSHYGPNACSNGTKVWLKTYPVCDAPLSNSALRSLVLLQNSRRNHRCYG